MIVSKKPEDSGALIKIKSADVTVSVNEIKIENFTISSPGEYDVSGVACEVPQIGEKIIALIEGESILTGVLNSKIQTVEIPEDFANVSVLLLFVDKEDDLKTIASLVDRIEPQIVFYFNQNGVDLKNISGIEIINDGYKITKNDLVIDGTKHFLFE